MKYKLSKVTLEIKDSEIELSMNEVRELRDLLDILLKDTSPVWGESFTDTETITTVGKVLIFGDNSEYLLQL